MTFSTHLQTFDTRQQYATTHRIQINWHLVKKSETTTNDDELINEK